MLSTVEHKTELCIIGGGLAGMGAAVEAARNGVKTVLIHERPVLGGNASSEIRMWICGMWGYMETGLVEELRQENIHRNPDGNYSVWDMLLYEKLRFQKNLTLLLNCSCMDAEMEVSSIKAVKGWQMTTQQFHRVEADFFADCSGDSILAPLTGAEFRCGREGKAEFGESMAPDVPDKCTMGMSCLMQAREYASARKFTPPSWAHSYPDDSALENRYHLLGPLQNFWFLELGGDRDSIGDTEDLRDELLKTAIGVWDHIKNHGDHGADNWALDWIGFLPGKRESRRYVGDYIMTQDDILSGRHFPDSVAYGGWPVDDHFPGGFLHRGVPNTHVYPERAYGIPLRSLYSCNINNLFFAGRNISVSHMALSSTRVMATCMLLGQAVGAAAAVCLEHKVSPREAAEKYIDEIQQRLMEDDCTLPGMERRRPELTVNAKLTASSGNGENLRRGADRDAGFWEAENGDWAEYDFGSAVNVREIRVIFDTDLERKGDVGRNLPAGYTLDMPEVKTTDKLIAGFTILADGKEIFHTDEQYLRCFRLPADICARRIKLQIDRTRGASGKVFAFDVKGDEK
ncbi:MAG: FAD-dependent oxidoreductase [Lentisphaeria bacterium]|nr:FAD-dependent oxidoreductase [Lentisphaeria bacterium]